MAFPQFEVINRPNADDRTSRRHVPLSHPNAGTLPSPFSASCPEACHLGSIPTGNAADFFGKAELLEKIRAQHEKIFEMMEVFDFELYQQQPLPHLSERFPTAGDFTIEEMALHESPPRMGGGVASRAGARGRVRRR